MTKVLLRYCDGIATVLLHRISLVHPFYIPCTSLIHDWRLRKLDRASTKPGDAFEGIGLAAIQSALRPLLLAWRRFGMQAGAGDAGENAASEVLERGGQRGRVPGEEFRAPFGQFAAGIMGLPVFEELLGFGGAAGLLEGEGADEIAGPLPFRARGDGQDTRERLAAFGWGFAPVLALAAHPDRKSVV